MKTDETKCIYCEKPNSEEELRPYGPNGSWLCYPCMTSDSKREEEAYKQFSSQLDAAGPIAVIGTEAGPIPLTNDNLH